MTATLTPPLRQMDPIAKPMVPADTEEATVQRSRSDGPPALLIDNVTKRFVVGRKRKPVIAINGVSMRLERGDIHGVLGANGSGKSTLIRLVSSLLTLDTGRVEVFGHDLVREETPVKRLINRVSVDAAFFKKLSPMENLSFAARLYGLDPKTSHDEAIRILERLGISQKRVNRPIEQMSRGMQQKVAIARALLTSPALLLLDEPTTGLDPRCKLDVQTFIEELVATHDAIDRAHDPRPGRGRTPLPADLDPEQRPGRRGSVAGRAQAHGRREPRPGADARGRVHDLHGQVARRRRRGRRVRRRLRAVSYGRWLPQNTEHEGRHQMFRNDIDVIRAVHSDRISATTSVARSPARSPRSSVDRRSAAIGRADRARARIRPVRRRSLDRAARSASRSPPSRSPRLARSVPVGRASSHRPRRPLP